MTTLKDKITIDIFRGIDPMSENYPKTLEIAHRNLYKDIAQAIKELKYELILPDLEPTGEWTTKGVLRKIDKIFGDFEQKGSDEK